MNFKKISFLFFLSFSLNTFAHHEFSASFSSNEKMVEVRFQTVYDQRMICHLDVLEMKVKTPSLFWTEMKSGDGKISLKVGVHPHTFCAQAIGSHSGSIVFQRGNRLPALPSGDYQVEINGDLMKETLKIVD